MSQTFAGSTALFRSPVFKGHDTGEHPENPSRMTAIDRELKRRDLLADRPEVFVHPAPASAILRVHDRRLVERLEGIAESGGGWVDADTRVRPDSVDVSKHAAGAIIAAVDGVLNNSFDHAFVISRPPGHHATPTRSMGFCLFNTIAIGAAHAVARGVSRVAILDWDVHHGNGTQDVFYDRNDVLYCSIHRSPFYPGTGLAAEQGAGKGNGFTINVPLPAWSGGDVYLSCLRELFAPAITAFRPELLLVSAGYDAHVDDPLGGMRVTDGAFQQFTRIAIEIAATCCDGRLILNLEGGYDPPALARCVADAIETLDGKKSDHDRVGSMVEQR